jgi:hypothetical protein
MMVRITLPRVLILVGGLSLPIASLVSTRLASAPRKIVLTFFSLMIGDKLAGLYAQMLQWGDDPYYFPIHAHKLLKADKKEHKRST